MNVCTKQFANIPMQAKFSWKCSQDHVIASTIVWWYTCSTVNGFFFSTISTVSNSS